MRPVHDGTSGATLHRCAAAPIFVTRRKDAIMLNLFKSLIPVAEEKTMSERERAYLNASVSRYDLERREREIDRGLFRQPHPYL
jgi:hypothetical protein